MDVKEKDSYVYLNDNVIDLSVFKMDSLNDLTLAEQINKPSQLKYLDNFTEDVLAQLVNKKLQKIDITNIRDLNVNEKLILSSIPFLAKCYHQYFDTTLMSKYTQLIEKLAKTNNISLDIYDLYDKKVIETLTTIKDIDKFLYEYGQIGMRNKFNHAIELQNYNSLTELICYKYADCDTLSDKFIEKMLPKANISDYIDFDSMVIVKALQFLISRAIYPLFV